MQTSMGSRLERWSQYKLMAGGNYSTSHIFLSCILQKKIVPSNQNEISEVRNVFDFSNKTKYFDLVIIIGFLFLVGVVGSKLEKEHPISGQKVYYPVVSTTIDPLLGRVNTYGNAIPAVLQDYDTPVVRTRNFAKMSEDTYVWRLRLTDKREIVSTFEQDMATFDRECPSRQIIGWTIVERYCPMSTADICPPVPPEKPVKTIPSVVWIATKRK